MLFDALERVYTVVNANFNTDLNTLAVAKGVMAFTATVIKRQTAAMTIAKAATKPTIGIYSISAQTQMADGGLGGKRDSLCIVAADLVITGPDAGLVQKQIELGAEVLVKAMTDRVPQGTTTTFAGGLARQSVTVDISDGYTDAQAPDYIGVATVTVPVWDRDNTT